jgi:hypothetical protein
MSKKVRFTKAYTTPDPDNFTFHPGWVAEFSDSDADRLVSDGYGTGVPYDTRCRRNAVTADISAECIPPQSNATEVEMPATFRIPRPKNSLLS